LSSGHFELERMATALPWLKSWRNARDTVRVAIMENDAWELFSSIDFLLISGVYVSLHACCAKMKHLAFSLPVTIHFPVHLSGKVGASVE